MWRVFLASTLCQDLRNDEVSLDAHARRLIHKNAQMVGLCITKGQRGERLRKVVDG